MSTARGTSVLAPGSWPVMLTPFRDDRSVDFAALDRLVDWYVDSGSAGLFTVSRSSEMYHLSPAERLRLARHVVERADGRVEVVATGTFGHSPQGDADAVLAMAATGVRAVVIITSHLAPPESGHAEVVDSIDRLLAATGDVELGFYECPEPWKRLLGVEVYAHAARSGRFVFHKDTSHSLAQIRAKIAASAGTRLQLYNAQTSSIVEGIRAGAAGCSAISANYCPQLASWLCRTAGQDHPLLGAVQDLLTIAEGLGGRGYPTSTKQFVNLVADLGLSPVSRMDGARELDAHAFGPLEALGRAATRLQRELDTGHVASTDPGMGADEFADHV